MLATDLGCRRGCNLSCAARAAPPLQSWNGLVDSGGRTNADWMSGSCNESAALSARGRGVAMHLRTAPTRP
uniref:Uncharacterized protein n=1 Tax=Setaria viridis TaxID=4556 RepID=A0A4U6UYR2_SETVI|nr:hypothetical protein SEVIR_4G147000v2 [Setaria viridis]